MVTPVAVCISQMTTAAVPTFDTLVTLEAGIKLRPVHRALCRSGDRMSYGDEDSYAGLLM